MPDPDNLATRLTALIDLARLELDEVDRLARLKSNGGHTGQIARGAKPTPRASTITAIARVFGTTAEYLVDGRGNPPSQRRVRRAVAEARERLGGIHGVRVPPRKIPRKRSTRTGLSSVQGASRSAGVR